MNESQSYSNEFRQDDRVKEKLEEVGVLSGTEQFNKR